MVSGKTKIKNPTGLHLRPAGLFCKTAMQFASKITVRKQARNEEVTANAKSVLSVLGACIKSGDEIEVICEGSDETSALAEMIRIIEDGLGEFSAIREALRKYYPEDVRIKKIAARAAKMAQSGQYNYGRCMRRGDTVAAMLALDEFVRQAISMVYLLNRTYMPYYKWMFRGMENFQILPEVAEKIRELSVMGDTSEMWKPPFPPGWNPYVNQLDPRVGRIEEICQAVVGELRKQGLTDSRDAFLEAHTWEIMKRIQDPELKKCHVMEG